MKKILILLVKLSIPTLLLYWLFESDKLKLDFIYNLQPIYIMACTALSIFTIYLISIRLKLLLESQKIRVNAFYLFKINLIGLFYNIFIPGGISGDVAKSYYLLKFRTKHISKTPIFLSLVMDRLIGLHALIFLGLITSLLSLLIVNEDVTSFIHMSIAIFLSINLVFVLFFNKKLFSFLYKLFVKPKSKFALKLFNAAETFANNKTVYIKSFFISLITQFLSVLILILIIQSLDISVNAVYTFLSSVYTFIVNIIPISPGGLGVGEVAFENLLLFFSDQEHGASIFLTARIFFYLPSLLGIVFFITTKR